LPSLENLHRHFEGESFVLLAVDVEETKDIVQKLVQNRDISFDILLDEDGEVSAQYNVREHPKKILIDPQGNVIGTSIGYKEWDTDEMKSLFQMLISSKG
jgi:peroxiredoxin